jgi:carotenoid cleavage dioxygenase
MTDRFPASMDFAGYNAPSRIECDIYDLVLEGTLPDEIEGSWYRSVPDPQYPPFLGDDTFLSGDGMVSRFRFEHGHVDLRQRYVQTARFKAERAARRSLFGRYRNPYTDDPSVRGVDRGANNTTPIWHGGRLLALKEDSRAVELDPHTLETRGPWDYQGQLRSQTMTAHTRADFDTGELYFFGYEAGGLATRDVAYCVADRNGRLLREEWFEAPYVSMMHDFAVTKEHAIFPVFPTTASLERIKAGGPHWIYEPSKDIYVGIMPRNGSVRDLRWFRRPAGSAYHFLNAYSEGQRVHLDFGLANMNPFPFIREASNIHMSPADIKSQLVRWTFDLAGPGENIEEQVLGPPGDLPRIANRDHMRDYQIGYYQRFDPAVGPPLVAGPVGAGFNTITRLQVKTGQMKNLAMDARSTVQEHVHVASRIAGHEGYLMFVVDRHDTALSEVFVVEAEHLDRGPLARIQLPFRLRCGVHGNWVPAEELPAE